MIVCKNCGAKNPNDRSVCVKCGAFLYEKNPQFEKDPKVLRKMRWTRIWNTIKSMGLMIIVLLVSFIVLSVLMFFVIRFFSSRMDWPTEEDLQQEMEEFQKAQESYEAEQSKNNAESDTTRSALPDHPDANMPQGNLMIEFSLPE